MLKVEVEYLRKLPRTFSIRIMGTHGSERTKAAHTTEALHTSTYALHRCHAQFVKTNLFVVWLPHRDSRVTSPAR